jgi:hypothetical protein
MREDLAQQWKELAGQLREKTVKRLEPGPRVLVVRYDQEDPVELVLPKHQPGRRGSPRPDCEAQLDALHEIVEGSIESCYPSHFNPPSDICLFINAGPLDRCPPYNRWGIFGNFLFAKHNAHGTCVSLTDKEVAWCKKMLRESRGLLDAECRTLCQVAKDNEPPRGWKAKEEER